MEDKYKRFVNFKVELCLLSIFISGNCFLIEPDNTVKPNTNGTGQCLAINEFLAEKKELKHQIDEVGHEIYQLKHDNDQTITVLTEQLKQKLSIMEDKLSKTRKQNDSTRLFDLEIKYTLMAENVSKVQEHYHDLQIRHNTEIGRLTNVTVELEKKLTDLERLKSVNQTLNLQNLENLMQSLQRKISLLEINQNARNQDFLALYNMTLDSSKKVKQLMNDFSNDLLKLTENQTQTFEAVNLRIKHIFSDISGIKNQLQSVTNEQNRTSIDVYSKMAKIADLMTENSRKVSMTACSNGVSADIVKFPNILTSVGINDIVSFKSTGKFVCEFSGLYFISSYIRSDSRGFPYHLKKNGNVISSSATTYWPSSTGTATSGISAAVDCQKNDELYISYSTSVSIVGTYSCFTILKVK